MDPPTLPPLPTSISTTPAAGAAASAGAGAATLQLNYPDSVDSSPRSRNAETWVDEPLPPVPGAKLRFMCSYGGHIIPRPHDKSLCYVGGETRIVVVERHSSLSVLCTRLSRTLLNGRPFTLKYQLPSEDLDSLISLTTDEDLENMIEEYDRTISASPLKPSRLRLFIFFAKPETTASMGALLDDAKSETWFVDALNGSGLLPRGFSDSATMDCLVSLDGVRGNDSSNDLEAQGDHFLADNKHVMKNHVHDLHSMPDSPMVENTSSFGSSSSSPSMSNLPPIRVHVDDNNVARPQDHYQKVGAEEQFAQISFAPPSLATAMAASSGTVVSDVQVNAIAFSGENTNRVFSDDERSDQGAPVGFRKPPLPILQPVQVQKAGGFSLPSPESVASDSSIASATSLSKPMYYHQDQVHVPPREIRAPASPSTLSDNSDLGSGTYMNQQVKDSGYVIPPQFDHQQQQQQQQQAQQQQFVHASTRFIHHPATGSVPISSYYPFYAPQSQQQFHHPIDQQYPVYVMPVPQKQPYNMGETTVVSSSRPLTSASPPPIVSVSANTNYKDGIPPVYPTKTASPAMNSTPPPALVQIPPAQFQQQYVGYTQMHQHHHPSQSIAVASSAAGNYGYEYANPSHEQQVYYTQHPSTSLPSQYQTMTPAAAAAAMALSDAAKQHPTENTQQQNRTSQPV